jgi:hypothetical protein
MTIKQSGWAARATHSRAYAGLFLLFLVFGLAAGITIGRSIFRVNRQIEKKEQVSKETVTQPATGQNSWLILGVDNLKGAAPRLQSVWLALFFPGKPAVTLLPVFPVPGGESLGDTFSFDRRGDPGDEFTYALHEKRLWWTGYIVLDASALTDILDQLENQGSSSLAGPVVQDMVKLTETGGSFSTIQHSQTNLLAGACRQANGLLSFADAQRLAADLSPHLRTDLNLAQVTRAWPVTEAGKLKVDCEFPMMAVSR